MAKCRILKRFGENFVKNVGRGVGEEFKLQFIGLWSDGRGGDTIHPHPPPAAGAGRHLPPRGRQDFFVFLVIQKLICNSVFLALGERGTYLTTCLPLGEGGTP